MPQNLLLFSPTCHVTHCLSFSPGALSERPSGTRDLSWAGLSTEHELGARRERRSTHWAQTEVGSGLREGPLHACWHGLFLQSSFRKAWAQAEAPEVSTRDETQCCEERGTGFLRAGRPPGLGEKGRLRNVQARG